MADVNGDPEEIRGFARQLGQFCQDTRESLARLTSHLNELGSSSWSDEKYRDFREQYDQAAQACSRVLDGIEPEQVAHLNAIAARLDEYLAQR